MIDSTVQAAVARESKAADALASLQRTCVCASSPQINVSEDIQIISTIDVLDNLVLGQNPNSVPFVNAVPNNILAGSQVPPGRNNSLSDSITVKRAYARVTALNEQLEFTFGRMPNHWGLGMMANSGDCLDCDFGDSVDRVAVSFNAANHIFTPMLDWVSNGPLAHPFGRSGGQPLDAATWDDVFQYSLRINRIDHPEDIKEQLANHQWVTNYGAWFMWRKQARDLTSAFYTNADLDPNDTLDFSNGEPDERRNGNLYTGNGYLQLYGGNLELGIEGAIIAGSFRDRALPGDEVLGTGGDKSKVLMLGGAMELKYHLSEDFKGTALYVKAGGASGDSAPGFGALDRADTQRGTFGGTKDRDLNNFQFSPDYHVDLLMFRRIVGTVTDAWYVSPGVFYQFDDRVNGSFWVTYSQAVLDESTASCYADNFTLCHGSGRAGAGSKPMGLEFDAELAYGIINSPKGGAFRAALAGGVLFPFGAFDNPTPASGESGNASFAWTLQTRFYVTY
ncbi:MAG: TIGR04551 family protein [Myxococcota bacterium]